MSKQSYASVALLVIGIIGGGSPSLGGQDDAPDRAVYSVASLRIAYEKELPFLPDLGPASSEFVQSKPEDSLESDVRLNLRETPVALELDSTGVYVAARPGAAGDGVVTMTLGGLGADGPVLVDASAIAAIAAAVGGFLDANLGEGSFFVGVPETDIDPETGADLRKGRGGPLRLLASFEGPNPVAISSFSVRYAVTDHPELPDLQTILDGVEVEFVTGPDRLVPWRPGLPRQTVNIGSMPPAAQAFSAGAIQMVLEAISGALTDEGLMAVHVVPAQGELDPANGLADLRRGRTDLQLVIVTGLVRDIRSVAMGDRVDSAVRIDNPAHAWIRRDSPIQPATGTEVEGDSRHDLLRRTDLDEYLQWLSRHPGRRVDAAVAPAEDEFGVTLDYMVTEINPWTFYAQGSNTGTKSTQEWRLRAGIFNNQVSGHDDIMSLEYIVADPDETAAVIGSYEAYIGDPGPLRWRVTGSWSKFDAADVGFADERFTGESWSAGGEVIWNFYQHGQHFLDLIVGARFLDIEVDNAIVFIEGDEDFVLPYVGVRYERWSEQVATNGNLSFEFNASNSDVAELNKLGRLNPDEDWITMRWDVTHSFYLEPLLNRDAWSDLSTPESSTLAHEIWTRFRGQYAFDNRLIPQMEQVIGGMYSVRGYEESIIAGDDAYIFSAEYRLHVPRAMGIRPSPDTLFGQPFRILPQHPYGRADWDLILRGFVDIGHAEITDPFSFESSETLVGAGVGAQITIKRNVDVRVDFGFALEELDDRVSSGSSQVHIGATLLF